MPAIPRLILNAVECLDDGIMRDLGKVDITRSIAALLSRSPGALDLLEKEESGILVRDIASDLPRDVQGLAWDGRLRLPDHPKAIRSFVEACGGIDEMARLQGVLRDMEGIERRIKATEERLKKLLAARWQSDLSGMEYVYLEDIGDGFHASPEDALEDWRWDDYQRLDRSPREEGCESDAYKGWQARYAAWVRRNAPPYAVATRPFSWLGLSEGRVREAWQEIVEYYEDPKDRGAEMSNRIQGMIEGDLEDHHEDVEGQVVDPDEVYEIVSAWLPFAETGSEEDRALGRKLEVWSAKQTLISYEIDESVCVPAFPDATQTEAVVWCEELLARCREELARIEDAWTSFAPAPST